MNATLASVIGCTKKALVGIDYEPTTDVLSLSDGKTLSTGKLDEVGPVDWLTEVKFVAFDPAYFHRDMPDCPVNLDSPLYIHHVFSGEGAATTLDKLTVKYLGLKYAPDARALVLVYEILAERLAAEGVAKNNHYKLLRGPSLRLAR